jgi:fructoselysine 6-kinase
VTLKTPALCLGDNCVDYYLPPINLSFVGGNAVNVSIAMQYAGLPSAYVGLVGEDEEGRLILRRLREHGIDVSHVRVIPGQTGKTHICLTPQGERQFLFEHLGPVFPIPLDEEILNFTLQHNLIHTTCFGGAQLYLPEIKKKPDILVSMDYGERYSQDFVDETIALIDLAFFSLPENFRASAKDFASQMYRPHLRLLLTTMGKGGSLAFNGNFHYQPASPIDVLDSLGAGDAYIGTFLANWYLGNTIIKSMEQASQAAARACTHLGAWMQTEP